MAVETYFLEEVLDRLSSFGEISSKFMFGGAGIFVSGKMFAKISSSSVLSFKADDQNRTIFIDAGMIQPGKMPYFETTAEQMENEDAFLSVARLARDAALRGKVQK